MTLHFLGREKHPICSQYSLISDVSDVMLIMLRRPKSVWIVIDQIKINRTFLTINPLFNRYCCSTKLHINNVINNYILIKHSVKFRQHWQNAFQRHDERRYAVLRTGTNEVTEGSSRRSKLPRCHGPRFPRIPTVIIPANVTLSRVGQCHLSTERQMTSRESYRWHSCRICLMVLTQTNHFSPWETAYARYDWS